MISASARSLVEELKLSPHPEGGFYREIFRSSSTVTRRSGTTSQARSSLTSIYYMLLEGQVSRWHVVASDEVWHFYRGEPLELLTFDAATFGGRPESQRVTITTLGLEETHQSVAVVPAGIWQAARPLGQFALCGCTVGPGFDFEDFEFANDLKGTDEIFQHALAGYEDLR